MACQVVSCGRVVLVVWGKPELHDLERIEAEVRRVYQEMGPVVFIARVPARAGPPDSKVRAALTEFLDRFLVLCRSYHAVFEGDSLLATAKRSILATLFLMTGKSGRHHVHARCEDVPGVHPVEQRPELRDALTVFERYGLLDRDLERLGKIEDPRIRLG